MAAKQLCAAAVLGIVLAGCGNSQRQGTQTVDRSKPPASTHYLPLPNGRHRKPGESACTDARVSAAKQPKAIDIVVHCFGASRHGSVRFSVRRETSNRPRPFLKLLRYEQVPQVTTGGSTGRAGRCQLADRALGCEAHVHGKSTIAERIWVRHGDRCTHVVSVTRVASSQCVGGNCDESYSVYQLFRGRPQGC